MKVKAGQVNFWQNQEEARQVSQRLSDLQTETDRLAGLEKEIQDLVELEKMFGQDEGLDKELEEKLLALDNRLTKEELNTFLSGRYDQGNALLEIFAGAGGQDSQDWATMLFRMYQRYAEKQGWSTRILEQSFGDAGGPEGRIGTKSATLEVKGKYAFGFLQRESGVHRLVRLSPFSSQALRHTSFASVWVMPQIEDEKAVEIRPEDLKIDFYRASGPGGQNVNKRESSVRITHLPTGIVVACQVERLQGDNRKKAMHMLAAKLWQLKEAEKEKKASEIRGAKASVSWGNQIRSYVLHPYKMVKDLRTDVESSDPEKVLDGNLDEFVVAEIQLKKI